MANCSIKRLFRKATLRQRRQGGGALGVDVDHPGETGDLENLAHRRLLLSFIRIHLAEQREMPALAFWDQAAWNPTSS